MKHRVLTVLALAAVATAFDVSAASAADSTAATGSNVTVQPLTTSPCTDGNGSLCLYYLADDKGARVQTFGAIPCYDSCAGDPNYYFNDTAHGTTGYGDAVRNATHYAYNNDSSDGYAIFVYPNYAGAVDELCPDGSWTCSYFIVPPETSMDHSATNLGPTQNNNASQEYLSTLLDSGV